MLGLRVRTALHALIISVLVFIAPSVAEDRGWAIGPNSTITNQDSIANTRHNLSIPDNAFQTTMNAYRNDYDQVCVYCHTPHGASSSMAAAPLWNRTNPVANGATYELYTNPLTGKSLSSGNSVTEPGINSITCLSCHDGTVAIDSIINMPGSGGYDPAQETSVGDAFLDTWSNPTDGDTNNHRTLAQCVVGCHKAGGQFGDDPSFPNFSVFLIGEDLTNDHPIGVVMPDAVTYGFNEPTTVDGNKWFFDSNSDGRANRGEIRLYDSGGGDGYEIECASCHDPHGVVQGGGGNGPLIPSFLRVDNVNSNVCYTCHIK